MSEEFELTIENILENTYNQKKKKNSADKGKNAERNLCKLLSRRFGKHFERSLGSGARIHQVKGMSESAKNVFMGDISCPDGFKWVLESKCGYEDKIDFHSIWQNGNKTIDSFINQVTGDSIRANKKPMLLYKRNFKSWIVFIRKTDLPYINNVVVPFDYFLNYKDWVVIALDNLLSLDNIQDSQGNDFWFK